MYILVADGDRRFLELLRGVIEREGHEVVIVVDVARGLESLSARPPDLLVAGVALPDDGADELVRALRDQPQGSEAGVVLLATGAEHERRSVKTLVAECDIRRVLRRPFPMFDLVDLVQDFDLELAGEGGDEEPSLGSLAESTTIDAAPVASLDRLSQVTLPAAATYLRRPLARENLQRISRLWARRASGLLRLSEGPGRAEGWMTLGEGGPLDSDGWELISAALHGGQLEFEIRQVAGAGDHLGLGAMIFGRVRDPEQDDFLRRSSFQALLRIRADAPLSALPITPDTRSLLDVVDASRPLGELVSTMKLDMSAVAADLHALDAMGLLQLGDPVILTREGPRRRRSVSAQRLKRMSDDRSSTTASEVTSIGGSGGGSGRGGPVGRAPAARQTDADGSSDPTQVQPGGLRKRRRDPGSDWPRLRRRLAERGRSPATRQAAQQSDADRAGRVERLRKELDRIKDHDAAVVLSVPAGADRALIDQAAERMQTRYRAMSTDPALPREGQRLAEDMLVIIERAHKEMLVGRPTRGQPTEQQLPEEDRLLRGARDRIEQQRWPEALRLLRRARDLRLDHPGVLSTLGWATLHDPELDEQTRQEEARSLLLLAVQFAPDHGDANLLLARFLVDQDELSAAARYARRAVRELPDEPEAIALLRRIEAQLGSAD